MLTPRQRAYLRSLGQREPVILQVGKAGITGAVLDQLDRALAARELVKVRVLRNAPVAPEEAAERLAAATGAEPVGVLGRVVTLFRRNPEAPRIPWPEPGGRGRAEG